jgi:hypothetical protein
MTTNMTQAEVWKLGMLVRGAVKRFIEDQKDHEVPSERILELIPSLVEHVIYEETKENVKK